MAIIMEVFWVFFVVVFFLFVCFFVFFNRLYNNGMLSVLIRIASARRF